MASIHPGEHRIVENSSISNNTVMGIFDDNNTVENPADRRLKPGGDRWNQIICNETITQCLMMGGRCAELFSHCEQT